MIEENSDNNNDTNHRLPMICNFLFRQMVEENAFNEDEIVNQILSIWFYFYAIITVSVGL